MKKAIALVLVLAMALALSACGGGNKGGYSSPEELAEYYYSVLLVDKEGELSVCCTPTLRKWYGTNDFSITRDELIRRLGEKKYTYSFSVGSYGIKVTKGVSCPDESVLPYFTADELKSVEDYAKIVTKISPDDDLYDTIYCIKMDGRWYYYEG